MIDILEHYFWRSLPDGGCFRTNPNLADKVDAAGQLLPYMGSTTVFLLDEDTKAALQYLQDTLYAAAPGMLAERLGKETFHMTLHSLPDGKPGKLGLEEQMTWARQQAAERISQWRQGPALQMKTTWLFNMVNASVVLGLMPADPDSWRRLDEMYTALEAVRPLGYAMTPHITMAYYRPGVYDRTQLQQLDSALRNVDMELTLPMDALVMQNFTDMNRYKTVQI